MCGLLCILARTISSSAYAAVWCISGPMRRAMCNGWSNVFLTRNASLSRRTDGWTDGRQLVWSAKNNKNIQPPFTNTVFTSF
uniref:Putative secreted protein n=1 Tax=Anopheles darlingi TaxID=43151 RepID=A0A2M4DCB7_ANODA